MGALKSVVVVAGLCIAAPGASAAQFMWNFSQGNLAPAFEDGGTVSLNHFNGSEGKTSFGTSGGAVPNPAGGPVTYLHALPFDGGGNAGYGLDYAGVAGNGGGAYVNDYTVAYDVYVPGLNWTALFNTDPSHGNDADFYVAPDGAVGIGDLGYSAPGVIQPNTWHRVVFSHDRTNNAVRYHVDGVERFASAASPLDGRFSLYASDNPGADLMLLGEGDGSGNYTNEIYLASVYFADRALSASEAAGLGGVQPGGIVVPEPAALVGVGLTGVLALRRRR
jgi:hypothetical protein